MLSDELPHLYTLVVKKDNTFEVKIDGESAAEGSLFENFEPPFNPPAEIDDPEDSKPADWVDDAKMDDPEAVKPDDWDEDAPSEIPDEDAEKPEGWLDDEPLEIEDPDAEEPGLGRRRGRGLGGARRPQPGVRGGARVRGVDAPDQVQPGLQGQVVPADDR